MKISILLLFVVLISCQLNNDGAKTSKSVAGVATSVSGQENSIKIIGGTIGVIDDIKVTVASLPSQKEVDLNPKNLHAGLQIDGLKNVTVKVGTVVKLTEDLQIKPQIIQPYSKDDPGFVQFKIMRRY